MAVDISERVQEIARERGLAESEVLERALERGVEDLYRDVILSRYLQGDLSREEAVDAIGLEVVRRADREEQNINEDLAWGTDATRTAVEERRERRSDDLEEVTDDECEAFHEGMVSSGETKTEEDVDDALYN